MSDNDDRTVVADTCVDQLDVVQSGSNTAENDCAELCSKSPEEQADVDKSNCATDHKAVGGNGSLKGFNKRKRTCPQRLASGSPAGTDTGAAVTLSGQ